MAKEGGRPLAVCSLSVACRLARRAECGSARRVAAGRFVWAQCGVRASCRLRWRDPFALWRTRRRRHACGPCHRARSSRLGARRPPPLAACRRAPTAAFPTSQAGLRGPAIERKGFLMTKSLKGGLSRRAFLGLGATAAVAAGAGLAGCAPATSADSSAKASG